MFHRVNSVLILVAIAALLSFAGLPRASAQNSTIEALTGPVTAVEISTFKAAISGLQPGNSNGGNNYAYGNSGDVMEACGDMYDITRDRAILDKFMVFCDKLLTIRNTTRVMWTGNIDPVWPNSSSTTWGCEQGDVVQHLAYCAQVIGQNPSLWSTPVGIGDPNGFGATYKARAMLYLTYVDQTMDLFYQHNFIHADEYMQTPPSPPWPEPNSANDATPWNQQSMVCAAFIRGADAHSLFGDGSSKIAKYRKTAKASQTRFSAQCNNFKYTKNGKTVCKWSYSGGTFAPGAAIRYPEDCAHGGYDITAMFRGRHWLANAVNPVDGLMIADTLMEVIKSGTQFYSRVDGTGSLGGMKNSWTYLAEWRPDVFPATVHTGSQHYADAAKKLWIKNAMTNGWTKPMSLGFNLQDGWIDSDIGEPAISGEATYSSGLFTLKGSGAGIGPTSDQFNLTYQSVPNDFVFTARVASQGNTNASAKSGIMARAGMDADAPFVSAVVTPSSGLLMQYRLSASGSVATLSTIPAVTAPCWLRLTRLGNTFTGYRSADGSNWTLLNSVDAALTRTVVGLAVAANNIATLNTSTFDQVNLIASGFSLDVDPSSSDILPGGSTTYNVAIVPTNGFSSNVTLSAVGLPANVTASFNPPVVTSSGSSILTLTASNFATLGSYSFTINGTGGGLAAEIQAGLAVNELPPSTNTDIYAADNAWVQRSDSNTVESAAESLQVKRLNDTNTRMAYVRFNLNSYLNTHAVPAMTSAMLRLTIPTAASGGGTLKVYGLIDTAGSDALWSSTTTTWNNQPAKSAAPNDIPNVDTALPNGNTTALLGSLSIPSTAGNVVVTLNLQSFIAFLGADTNQQVTLLFVNTGSSTVNFASLANTGGYALPTLELICPVSDFSLSGAPDSKSVSTGGSATYTVTVAPINGFANPVALSIADLPPGVTAEFTPDSINGSGSSALRFTTASDTLPDIYILTVTGTSGPYVRATTVTLDVIPDSDDDGVPDAWTIQYFGHPMGQASDNSRASDDADGDGASNMAEYLSGNDPLDPRSHLRIDNVVIEGNNVRVSWSAIGGKRYVVAAGSELQGAGDFTEISSPIQIAGTGAVAAEFVEVGGALNTSQRFYRVRVEP